MLALAADTRKIKFLRVIIGLFLTWLFWLWTGLGPERGDSAQTSQLNRSRQTRPCPFRWTWKCSCLFSPFFPGMEILEVVVRTPVFVGPPQPYCNYNHWVALHVKCSESLRASSQMFRVVVSYIFLDLYLQALPRNKAISFGEITWGIGKEHPCSFLFAFR